MQPVQPAEPFERIFRSNSLPRDNFLARLFGIFSEELVRIWCSCEQAPYRDVGRPTLRKPGQNHGHTLDFTFQDRLTGQLFAAEMKCWITWQDFRYLRLTGPDQLDGITEPAFTSFLAFVRNPADYQVFVHGKLIEAAGAILVWGAATPEGRSGARVRGIAAVLTAEDIIRDLHDWQPTA